MKKQNSGYIFNIASRAGKVGVATQGGYAASKFGVVGLNDSLFNELASFGIKVTAICPGWVDTDLGVRSSLAKEDKILVEDVVKTIPFLLGLSPNCCIKEIVLECRKTVELANNLHLKK
jgi:3-oxoacyl-[acyl-carrier protein] reductase